jgi:hypothetical protein
MPHTPDDVKNALLVGTKLQFPWKLACMLIDVEKKGDDSIVSWLPHGKAFKVHDKQRFVAEIMPQYFFSNKYKSFQRNLNLWNFECVRQGTNKGSCFHPLFLRDLPQLCHRMMRQQTDQTARSPKSSKKEPMLSGTSSEAKDSKKTTLMPRDASSSRVPKVALVGEIQAIAPKEDTSASSMGNMLALQDLLKTSAARNDKAPIKFEPEIAVLLAQLRNRQTPQVSPHALSSSLQPNVARLSSERAGFDLLVLAAHEAGAHVPVADSSAAVPQVRF